MTVTLSVSVCMTLKPNSQRVKIEIPYNKRVLKMKFFFSLFFFFLLLSCLTLFLILFFFFFL